tara:strand:- start:135 stop:290 length:156 start_codon:yes stop_codon:yes gene_type:complete
MPHNKYEDALEKAMTQRGGVPLHLKIPVRRKRFKEFEQKKKDRERSRNLWV